MKIAVINLPSATGRWNAVRDAFAAAGLPAERVDAVSGDALCDAQRARLYCHQLNRAQYHKPLRPGEIGCYASHIGLWQALLASRERCMAIFEDDIEVDRTLPSVLSALERGGDWDMVKLFGRRREAVRASEPLSDGAQLIQYLRVPGQTCAYVLHRRGAEKLLARRVPFGRPIDVDLRHWWECALDIRGVLPYPVRSAETSLASSIDGGRRGCSGAAMRLRKLAWQARYAFNNWQAGDAVQPQHGSPQPALRERRDAA